MGIAERKGRHRAEREHRIVAAARLIAESEGWSAVTIRRLAEEIEHSQPVLYSHFESRDAIVAAVAIEGFRQITAELQDAARGFDDRRVVLLKGGATYLAFARNNPAVYEAMFTLPTGLFFAKAETRAELKAAFDALVAVVRPERTDVDTATETFWAALHGLAQLERSGRIRKSARAERLSLIVTGMLAL